MLSSIRDLFRTRLDLMNSHTAYSNRLTALLDQSFPGYSKAFSKVTVVSSLHLLKAYPSPQSLLDADTDTIDILSVCARKGTHTAYVKDKLALLLRTAEEAIGLNVQKEIYHDLIVTIVDVFQGLQSNVKHLEKRIQ